MPVPSNTLIINTIMLMQPAFPSPWWTTDPIMILFWIPIIVFVIMIVIVIAIDIILVTIVLLCCQRG